MQMLLLSVLLVAGVALHVLPAAAASASAVAFDDPDSSIDFGEPIQAQLGFNSTQAKFFLTNPLVVDGVDLLAALQDLLHQNELDGSPASPVPALGRTLFLGDRVRPLWNELTSACSALPGSVLARPGSLADLQTIERFTANLTISASASYYYGNVFASRSRIGTLDADTLAWRPLGRVADAYLDGHIGLNEVPPALACTAPVPSQQALPFLGGTGVSSAHSSGISKLTHGCQDGSLAGYAICSHPDEPSSQVVQASFPSESVRRGAAASNANVSISQGCSSLGMQPLVIDSWGALQAALLFVKQQPPTEYFWANLYASDTVSGVAGIGGFVPTADSTLRAAVEGIISGNVDVDPVACAMDIANDAFGLDPIPLQGSTGLVSRTAGSVLHHLCEEDLPGYVLCDARL